MAINRNEFDLEFECDECGNSHEFDKYAKFSECWEELKTDGWRAFKTGEDHDWQHRCPDCVGK